MSRSTSEAIPSPAVLTQTIAGAGTGVATALRTWRKTYSDTRTEPLHIFSVPMESRTKLYMRLKVTNPERHARQVKNPSWSTAVSANRVVEVPRSSALIYDC